MRDYEDALFLLTDAMITHMCYNSSAPDLGLRLNMNRLTLKCYMADTRFLISHAFDENQIVSEEIYKKVLFDKLEPHLGMVMENMVAQMLVASTHNLYFYSNSSRDDAASRMKIDVLIAKSTISNRDNISLIEVKSGKHYTLSSLKIFRSKHARQLHTPYVLHTKDVKEDDGITYLPLYMALLL